MPATLRERQTLSPPHRLAEADLTHPMLWAFADPANPPLADVLLRRRLAIEQPADDAQVVLADEAGEPLVLHRRIGDGHVVLWAFLPARAWSNLARLGGDRRLAAAGGCQRAAGDRPGPRGGRATRARSRPAARAGAD
ncbi:MAG: hypothetical protein GVY16_09825 [Planctomycetes bacterium]|nr:hypothetical protein [Planctomycetota bacterium]